MDNLEAYMYLLQYPVFSTVEVEDIVARGPTTYALLQRLMERGAIRRIRSGIYTPVDLRTGRILATPFDIAAAAAQDGFLVHRAAMACHGIEPDPVKVCQVACQNRFRTFRFDGITYKPARLTHSFGATNYNRVRATDLERTLLDAIHQPTVFGDLALLCRCLESVTTLNEQTLLTYLEQINSPTLYSKCGYLLQRYQGSLGISATLLQILGERKSSNTRYLGSQADTDNVQISQWNLRVPTWLEGV